ncbi:hypothetical protein ACLQ2M_41575, partial [Streptomyces sp. DT7]
PPARGVSESRRSPLRARPWDADAHCADCAPLTGPRPPADVLAADDAPSEAVRDAEAEDIAAEGGDHMRTGAAVDYTS